MINHMPQDLEIGFAMLGLQRVLHKSDALYCPHLSLPNIQLLSSPPLDKGVDGIPAARDALDQSEIQEWGERLRVWLRVPLASHRKRQKIVQ
jgi:hypothetical protein